MANIDDFAPNKYLNQKALKASGPVHVTIEKILFDAPTGYNHDDGSPGLTNKLLFTNGQECNLNNKNARNLADSYGKETNDWIGKDCVVGYDPSLRKGQGGVYVSPATSAVLSERPAQALVTHPTDPQPPVDDLDMGGGPDETPFPGFK